MRLDVFLNLGGDLAMRCDSESWGGGGGWFRFQNGRGWKKVGPVSIETDEAGRHVKLINMMYDV